MSTWADRLGVIVIDGAFSAALALAVLALGLVLCRQPARRVGIVRAGLVGLIAIVPLKLTGVLPSLEILAIADRLGRTGPSPPPVLEWLPGRWVTVVYLTGLLAGLGWLALGYFGLYRLAKRSTEPSAAVLETYFAICRGREGRRPRLRASEAARGPVLVGPYRPTIVVPSDLGPSEHAPGAESRLRLALLHELAHHDGRDPLYLLVGRVAQVFWWFLPPLWWALDRMRIDQEVLADRRAAPRFGPVGDYASSLLGLAAEAWEVIRSDPGAGESPSSGMERAPTSPLFQRLAMLVRSPFPVEPSPPASWSWGLPFVAAAVTIGAATIAIVPVRAPCAATSSPGVPRVFAMSRLDLGPSIALANGRAPRFELPLRLPRRFDLSIDVHASPQGLALTRIAGLALSSAVPDSTAPGPESWHAVRFARGPEGDRLWIDDQAVSAGNELDPLPVWLTLEPPPGLPGRYRNLILRW